MGDFAVETAVEGSAGRYHAALSPEWQVWGPNGGVKAAIALRALAQESGLPRPASFACQFFAMGDFAPVEIAVTQQKGGRRSEALRAEVSQAGRLLLAASAWFVAEREEGYAHEAAQMPSVPSAEDLQGYQDLTDDYAEWYPFWRSVEGRPVVWEKPGPPVWHTWLRLSRTACFDDPVLDAARSLLCLDTMMWNALIAPYEWPHRFLAPNLDLTAQFHAFEPRDDWRLCDAQAPSAGAGLGGCQGRVWSPGGRLLASGTSQLFQMPNPEYEKGLLRRREWEARRAR